MEGGEDSNAFKALGSLGYTKPLVVQRGKLYNHVSKIFNDFFFELFKEEYDILFAGSRGEGVGVSFETDHDLVFISREVKCFDSNSAGEFKECRANVLFEMDMANAPSGYCFLKLMRPPQTDLNENTFQCAIKLALDEKEEQYFLRNDRNIFKFFLQKSWNAIGLSRPPFDERRGPSKPSVYRFPLTAATYFRYDHVLALPCECSSITALLFQRERNGNWPEKELIEKVRSLPVHVVPVGRKGSDSEDLQWRISFTLAERALVQSFNDTQIKVYCAMKMLAKHELKPICDNITSYIVKMTIFWLSEKICTEDFDEHHFKYRLIDAIQLLKSYIGNENLPHYMIPSRNMLFQKISEDEKPLLIKRLDVLENNCLRVLTMYPVFRETPENVKQRELEEEALLAVFTLPSEEFKQFMKQLLKTEDEEERNMLAVDTVVHHVKRNNPFQLFKHFLQMSEDEIRHHFSRDWLK